jgi:hypothetical protein
MFYGMSDAIDEAEEEKKKLIARVKKLEKYAVLEELSGFDLVSLTREGKSDWKLEVRRAEFRMSVNGSLLSVLGKASKIRKIADLQASLESLEESVSED